MLILDYQANDVYDCYDYVLLGAVPTADIGFAVNIVVKAAVFAADVGLGVDVVKVVVAGCATDADVGCVEATG